MESTTHIQTTNKPVVENARETFSLQTPVVSTAIKRGETKSIMIAVSRGSEFKDNVEVTFSGIPAGVSLTPSTPTLGADDKSLKIDIEAGSDAEVGDFTVLVIGHPTNGGADATNHLKFSVAAK